MNEEELNQRVADLESRLDVLRTSVKVKDEEISQLKEELSTTRSGRDIFYEKSQRLEESTKKRMKQISLAVNLLSEIVE